MWYLIWKYAYHLTNLLFCFSVLTPYYSEEVLFSINGLETQNEDGVSILFYLQKIYPGQLLLPYQVLSPLQLSVFFNFDLKWILIFKKFKWVIFRYYLLNIFYWISLDFTLDSKTCYIYFCLWYILISKPYTWFKPWELLWRKNTRVLFCLNNRILLYRWVGQFSWTG